MVDRQPNAAPQDAHPSLRTLRAATASRHAAIELLLDLHGPISRLHYGRVLQGFASFLSAWEPQMAAALPDRLQAWFAQGRRLHLVHRDLAALGLPQRDQAAAPQLQNVGAAVGSLYVMEGSALGGQVIAGRVERELGFTAGSGAAYFHGAGSGTAPRWREFRALAEHELQGDARALNAAVRAAQQTFDALVGAFRPVIHDSAPA